MTESITDPASVDDTRRELQDTLAQISAENPQLDTSGTKGRPMIEWDEDHFEVRWVPVRK